MSYAPALWVNSLFFIPAGPTAVALPVADNIKPGFGVFSWIALYDETEEWGGNPLVLTLDPVEPGELIGFLDIELASAIPPGTVVTLDFLEPYTTLSNRSGTTIETTGAGLLLGSGYIAVDSSIFADGFETGTTEVWSGSTP